MGRIHEFEIEQVPLPYDPEELLKWRAGDPEIVPPEVLHWNGPGREHGYGYGEHIVKLFLEEKGLEMIVNQYNIFPVKKSKFEKNNAIILETLGKEKFNRLQKTLEIIIRNKLGIELPDICVLRPSFHFIEVKRDNDRLRPSQVMFAAAISAAMNIQFKVYKLLPIGALWDTATLTVKQELPEEIFLL